MWTPLPGTAPYPSPVEFRGLTKFYGKSNVLSGLDLVIEPGSVLGLIGTNGAGKTTLIKCLLDFCDVDGGSISIFGVPHTRTQARSRLVYLPERFNAPAYLSGEQYLQLLLKLQHCAYDASEAIELIQKLGMDPDALQRKVGTYSKGMAQKLGLALCLLAKKPLMVLDEPMSGLDPKSRVLFRSLISEYHQSGGSVFFSTHMLNDVETLCDRIAILHNQRIRYIGTPQQCREQFHAQTLEEAYIRCLEDCAEAAAEQHNPVRSVA